MHRDTVTIFNYYEDKSQNIAYWYPTLLNNVEVQLAEGQTVKKSGNENADKLWLSIPLICSNNELYADGVRFLRPKEYKRCMKRYECFTLAKNDFIIIGDYSNDGIINDDDYPDGYFQHMKQNYDDVYNINTVDIYKTIRHIEVGGR